MNQSYLTNKDKKISIYSFKRAFLNNFRINLLYLYNIINECFET